MGHPAAAAYTSWGPNQWWKTNQVAVSLPRRHSGLPHRAPREEGEERALFSVLGPEAFWGQEHSRCNFAADLRDQRGVGEPEASWGSATFAAQHCPLVSLAKTAPLGGGNLPAPWLGLTFSFFRPQALF